MGERHDPVLAAPQGLVYVTPYQAGLTRHRRGAGFAYRDAAGQWLSERRLEDRPTLARIRALAIPPAYTDVWICADPQGHIQAVGRDARGRRQYRYHPDWTHQQGLNKFGRLAEFAQALPKLRAQVRKDLPPRSTKTTPSKRQVLAALLSLLDQTHIRVGNDVYARQNQSYGLTTLRNEHVRVRGAHITLQFRGKSGVWHHIRLEDKRVARILRQCQQLPGQELFMYSDRTGETHRIGSTELNAYIRSVTGADFSAKDYRTWHATVHAWALLRPPSPPIGVAEVVKCVAKFLGNTPAVCRKAYIHPRVLQQAEGADPSAQVSSKTCPMLDDLSPDENSLLRFLLEQEASPPRRDQDAPVSPRNTSTRRLRARP